MRRGRLLDRVELPVAREHHGDLGAGPAGLDVGVVQGQDGVDELLLVGGPRALEEDEPEAHDVVYLGAEGRRRVGRHVLPEERYYRPNLRPALLVSLGLGRLARGVRLGQGRERRRRLLPLLRSLDLLLLLLLLPLLSPLLGRARARHLHHQLPLRRGRVSPEVPHHLRHESVVLDPVVPAVQHDHDTSDGRTRHGHAQGGLDPELDGPAPSLEEVGGGVGHELLPGRDAGLVDPAGEAAPWEEGELLRVVPEEAQVVHLVARQGHHPLGVAAGAPPGLRRRRRRRRGRREQHVVVVGHLDVHDRAPREAEPSRDARRGPLAPAPPRRGRGVPGGLPPGRRRRRAALGRDPYVGALERDAVVLDVRGYLREEGSGELEVRLGRRHHGREDVGPEGRLGVGGRPPSGSVERVAAPGRGGRVDVHPAVVGVPRSDPGRLAGVRRGHVGVDPQEVAVVPVGRLEGGGEELEVHLVVVRGGVVGGLLDEHAVGRGGHVLLHGLAHHEPPPDHPIPIRREGDPPLHDVDAPEPLGRVEPDPHVGQALGDVVPPLPSHVEPYLGPLDGVADGVDEGVLEGREVRGFIAVGYEPDVRVEVPGAETGVLHLLREPGGLRLEHPA
mmetsp:Transcript_35222/g.79008  ORF Transcript_35222/g.79008 Transcript_35222/m.79008 type:complete len:616 (+) Transcript_35222:701-2548(+)